MQAPLWWGIWLQHGTRLSTFQQLTTTRPTSTSASNILEYVATWNWYSNLTIDGSIYPSEHFAFGAVFVCQAGNLWTHLRIYIYIYNVGSFLSWHKSHLELYFAFILMSKKNKTCIRMTWHDYKIGVGFSPKMSCILTYGRHWAVYDIIFYHELRMSGSGRS